MAKKIKDPGVGYHSQKDARRVIESGQSNVLHLNRDRNVDDLYAYLIAIPWWLFFVYVLVGYIAINLAFALVYVFIGVQELTVGSSNFWIDLLNAFFFSAQTITTVGYGGISPTGISAGVISTFEALIGLLSFSFITGLLYGRFSKPKAKIQFSKNMIVREFEGGRALMFRLMSNRKNLMIEPEIDVTISISEKVEQGFKRNFYKLKLERSKVMFLPTMWTIVHKLDDESPFTKYSNEEIAELEGELFVLFQYHEEAFSTKVYQIHSYDFKCFEFDVKFTSSYVFDADGYTVVDHHNLHKTEEM